MQKILGFLLSFAALVGAPTASNAAETYVHAGRLLADPATGRVEFDKTVVIEDGKVVAIRDGFIGQGKVVDLRDSFVLPGLIDSHVHITLEGSASYTLDVVRKTSADAVVDGARNARRTLRAGFTTIVDLGGDPEAVRALRDGIAAGKLEGPRIIAAGVVGAVGGHLDVHGYRPDIVALIKPGGLCSGADDCRRAVRRAVQNGADLIKTAPTGGITSNTGAGVGKQIFDDELAAIVETAHLLGKRVTCHAHSADGVAAAVRAGVDSIEHGTYADEHSLRKMKQSGTYLVPTLLAGDTLGRLAQTAEWLPRAVREKALRVAPDALAAASRVRRSGVKIAFGTDSSISPHGSNAREFTLMVKGGFSPIEVIRAATTAGADHNGLSAEIGSISPGKFADLIAVKGDPLADVTELERIAFVMKSGEVVALN